MPYYTVNKNAQDNGDHEVHKTGCKFEPGVLNRVDLGYHADDFSALQKARKIYPAADGCAYCCPAIHLR